MMTHPEVAYQPETSVQSAYRAAPLMQYAAPGGQIPSWFQEEQDERKALQEAQAAGIDQRQVTNVTNLQTAQTPTATPASLQEPQSPISDSDVAGLLNKALHPSASNASVAGLNSPDTIEHASGYRSQNDQSGKQEFAKPANEEEVLASAPVGPPSQFMLMQGSRIPASLDPKIESGLPGEVTAIVRNDVHDSKTGRYTLIPAGTRIIGYYNSNITYGQQAVQVAWTRLIYPDTTSQNIGKMMAYDSDGSSGLHDQVDNHFKRLIGGVALSSMLSAGIAISQSHTNSSVLSYPTPGQEVGAAVGQQATQLGSEITSRNLNVQPTIKVRPGEIFYVSVNKDLVFSGPYVPR